MPLKVVNNNLQCLWYSKVFFITLSNTAMKRFQNQQIISFSVLVWQILFHPDLKRTLVAMSERTGMRVSQVADEVLYTGLVEMQEMDVLE